MAHRLWSMSHPWFKLMSSVFFWIQYVWSLVMKTCVWMSTSSNKSNYPYVLVFRMWTLLAVFFAVNSNLCLKTRSSSNQKHSSIQQASVDSACPNATVWTNSTGTCKASWSSHAPTTSSTSWNSRTPTSPWMEKSGNLSPKLFELVPNNTRTSNFKLAYTHNIYIYMYSTYIYIYVYIIQTPSCASGTTRIAVKHNLL